MKKQGGTGVNQHKEKRGDGFLNRPIRGLTVAAYLRCLYASVEFAPTVPLRKEARDNIIDPVQFRFITQLCDACNWDETANIGAKYLRLMRYIMKLPLDNDIAEFDHLMHY